MDKLKMQIKVTTLPCGHSEGVVAKMNPETGGWAGKCVQCGSPAGVEMHIETPSGMRPLVRKHFPAGSRVLVGINQERATVQVASVRPGTLGEFVHEVLIDGTGEVRTVLGSEMEAISEPER